MVTKNWVRGKLEAAIQELKAKDWRLLENDANERAITHKLAQFLDPLFPGWDVDCEYNKDGHKPKRLMTLSVRKERLDNTDGASVFPDIIVHHRGKKGAASNLIVIEVKKSSSRENTNRDIEKLRAFKGELKYQFAVSMVLEVKHRWAEDAQIEFM